MQPVSPARHARLLAAFVIPEVGASGRLDNLESTENRSDDHVRFNHAGFNTTRSHLSEVKTTIRIVPTRPLTHQNGQSPAEVMQISGASDRCGSTAAVAPCLPLPPQLVGSGHSASANRAPVPTRRRTGQ